MNTHITNGRMTGHVPAAMWELINTHQQGEEPTKSGAHILEFNLFVELAGDYCRMFACHLENGRHPGELWTQVK